MTGLEALEEIRSELATKGIALLVARAKIQIREKLSRSGFRGAIWFRELSSVSTKRGSVRIECTHRDERESPARGGFHLMVNSPY